MQFAYVFAVNQILTHWYAERLLWIRYQLVEAQQCKVNGKKNTKPTPTGLKG